MLADTIPATFSPLLIFKKIGLTLAGTYILVLVVAVGAAAISIKQFESAVTRMPQTEPVSEPPTASLIAALVVLRDTRCVFTGRYIIRCPLVMFGNI